MPTYQMIDGTTRDGKRTIDGCLRLREALKGAIPTRTLGRSLLLASWNIRQFGGGGQAERDHEAMFYLAQVIDKFDMVAIQEVKSDLRQLDELVTTLGGWWRYVVSDVCTGESGNSERMAFVYDSRKLSFGGLAGELETPGTMRGSDKKRGKIKGGESTSRSPYFAGFRAGWFKFTICTMHAYYGAAGEDIAQRALDARLTAERLRDRMKQKDRWARNAILLGDFNIFDDDDKTARSLAKEGFTSPHQLRGLDTNVAGDRPFDRLVFIAPDVSLQLKEMSAGVFPVFDHVYRDGEHAEYGKTAKAFSQWRTYRMSDHNPVWCEINIDFTEQYLESRRGKKPEQPRTR
jgi:exonuclease III